MAGFDFSGSLGDRFGGFLNSVVDVAKTSRELDIREQEAVSAAVIRGNNQQIAAPVNIDGAPVVQNTGAVAGIKTSTIVYLGLGLVALGGAVAVVKYA